MHADIAADVIAARDVATGAAFDREELVDQIAVLFLAGVAFTPAVSTSVISVRLPTPMVS